MSISIVKCDLCGAFLKDDNSLRRHNTRFHAFRPSPVIPKMACGMCGDPFLTSSDLESHVSTEHNIQVTHEKISFTSEDDFHQWKRTIEAENNASYVRSSFRKTLKKSLVYFVCNRSGQLRTRLTGDTRKRLLKAKGTRKIGGKCISRMNAGFFKDGSVEVDFCKTHCGHSAEPEHLPIPSHIRKELATKIATKIPFDKIINEVRSSAKSGNSNEMKREHFITNSDLRNIKRALPSESAWFLNHDEATSVAAWVEKERALDDDSSVLLFKPEGIMPAEFAHLQDEEAGGLKNTDFLLGIMTRGQEEVLKVHGVDGVISMESTLGTNSYGYELTTLMVLDDLQGFPAAFFISNRQDHMGVTLFLEKVKSKLGLIPAKTFMSNTAGVFYKAWRSVMGDCKFRLFSSWQVIRTWQQKIKELITLKSKKRESTFAKIHTLLCETDQNSFYTMLPSIIDDMSKDADTYTFAAYFRQKFSKNPKKWAYCHMKRTGVDTNMNLERLHSQIERIFSKRTKLKRLDSTIHALLSLIDRKIHDRILVSENGKLPCQMIQLRNRHEAAISMSTDQVLPTTEPNRWSVISFTEPKETCRVALDNPSCACAIFCDLCKTCFHKFTCTCEDYCIQNNMCKHVHLVCRFLSDNTGAEATTATLTDGTLVFEDESLEQYIHDDQGNAEMQSHEADESDSLPQDLGSKKIKLLKEVCSIINDINTTAGIEAFSKIMKSALPMIKAEDLRLNVEAQTWSQRQQIAVVASISGQNSFNGDVAVLN